MRETVGKFELQVLQLLVRHPREAYGIMLLEKLEELGRKSSVGALYTTLERLEKKGFVSSKWGEPTPERGGRRKRYYSITANGAQAVSAEELSRQAFATGLGLQGAHNG